NGLLLASPWIIGMGLFTLYPFGASIYYSFTDFSVLQKPVFIGLENYRGIAADSLFWTALRNTVVYAALAVPLGLFVSLTLALLMNAVRKGQAIYSAIFYLPHLIPATVAAVLWFWILEPEFGLLNNALRPIFDGLNWLRTSFDSTLADRMRQDPTLIWSPPAWMGSTTWALPALVLMALWNTGQTAFIYLAKLKDVPQELYEAAEIDGANTWQKIWHVTLPQISPVIFFNMIMAIIGSFQVFAEPFIMTKGTGSPANATLLMPHFIYNSAFRDMHMGYASALAWILFMIIPGLTALAFRLSRGRVHYAGK